MSGETNPFEDDTRTASDFEGHTVPEHFGSPEEEYRSLGERVGLLERSHRSRLSIRGGERTVFLQRLVSNDVAALREGRGCYALLLTPKGKLISDLTILDRGDEFLVDYPPEMKEEIFRRLTMYVLSSDVEVTDRTEDLSDLGLYGPGAVAKLDDLEIGEAPREIHGNRSVEIAGVEVLVVRSDPLGVDGFDLIVPRDGAGAVEEAVGASPVGFLAAEWRRIVNGRPRFGAEMDGDLLPPEIPFLVERAISYTKGCFVGQETVARIKTYGHVNRELRGLRIEAETPPAPGAEILVGEKKAGRVTSVASPPDLGFPIALALVKRNHLEPGTELEVMFDGDRIPAVVVPPGGPWS